MIKSGKKVTDKEGEVYEKLALFPEIKEQVKRVQRRDPNEETPIFKA